MKSLEFLPQDPCGVFSFCYLLLYFIGNSFSWNRMCLMTFPLEFRGSMCTLQFYGFDSVFSILPKAVFLGAVWTFPNPSFYFRSFSFFVQIGVFLAYSRKSLENYLFPSVVNLDKKIMFHLRYNTLSVFFLILLLFFLVGIP